MFKIYQTQILDEVLLLFALGDMSVQKYILYIHNRVVIHVDPT